MKTLFTLVLLSLVSFNTYADDLIRFKRIDQEIDHARVSCLHRDVISSSKTTQQVRSYQTVLAPRFFERLLDKSHFLSFENLKSLIMMSMSAIIIIVIIILVSIIIMLFPN